MKRRIIIRWDAVLTSIAAFGIGIAVGCGIATQIWLGH